MPISFELEGEKQLVRRFRGIELKGKDWKPTFKKIGKELTQVFSGPVFETRGGEIGEPWRPRKKPAPWPLLQKSGRMKKGFKYDAKKDGVEIYNIAKYFIYHQSGKPRMSKLPRRVMMKIDNKRKVNIMKTFQKDLIKILRPTRI